MAQGSTTSSAEAAGNDEGPNPYEYFLASLGPCTNMTAHKYATRISATIHKTKEESIPWQR